MKDAVTQRFEEVIKSKGVSDTAFGLTIGIPQSTLSCQLRSVKGVGLDSVTAALRTFPEISAEWLLRGIGSMYFEDNLPTFHGEEKDNEVDLKIELSKAIAEKEELLREIADLKNELTKKIGCIEGQQDYISKLVIENNVLSKMIENIDK